MKFAVNYSNPLIRLIKDKAVAVDLIKCPDWEGMLTEAEQYSEVTIHFDLEVGLKNTFNADLYRIKKLMDSTYTPHVNTHLVTPRQLDADNPAELRQINTLWREEIQHMADHLGAKYVALEHHPYTITTPHLRPATDPATFSQVIHDTGCMFLLDLAHARITADILGVDVKKYIRALPLDRLVEMHITGIKTHCGVLTDHFELGEGDWALFIWALEQIRAGHWRKPKVIAFEYGGIGQTFVWRTEYEVIKSQVPKLGQLINEFS